MAVLLKSFGKMCKGLGKSLDRMGAGMQGKKAVIEERILVLAALVMRSFAFCSRFEIRREQALHLLRFQCRYECHRLRRSEPWLLFLCGLRQHPSRWMLDWKQ